MKQWRIINIFIIILLSLLVFIGNISCSKPDDIVPKTGLCPGNILEEDYEEPGLPENDPIVTDRAVPDEQTKSIVLAIVGDIMVHSPQITSAFDESRGRYNFTDCFSHITPYFNKADFVIGNLETTFKGAGSEYSGYPLFNSPPELADALKESGFNLLFTANNHCMDSGEKGVIGTINLLEQKGLDFVGTARHQEERKKGFLLCQNGVKIAFFAYTYGTNGIPIPSGKEYLVSLINEQLIAEDINRAKTDLKADLVVIGMHWGEEYQRLPSSYQTELAIKVADMGADLIIGNHPHVVQTAEVIETTQGKSLVLYSLGNFISNQRWRYTDSGVVVFVEIQLNTSLGDSPAIAVLEIVPTWVHKYFWEGKWRYTVLPVHEVLETENARDIYKLTDQDWQRIQEIPEETEEIFRDINRGL